MKMTPEEAINAATINGAYAITSRYTHGSNHRKKRNLIITVILLLSIALTPLVAI
jgi:imidazolonepropionase